MVAGAMCLGVIKLVDLTDPDVMWVARLCFGVGGALTLATLALIYVRIQRANDQQELVMTGAERNPPQPLAAMLGAPQEPDANKQITLTTQEYDMGKLKALVQSTCTTLAITTALHAWKGFMPPLVLQSVLPFVGLWSSELARIHLLGQSASGSAHKDLRRPWKPKSPFAAFKDIKKEMQSITAPDDKGASAKQRKNKKEENRKKAR